MTASTARISSESAADGRIANVGQTCSNVSTKWRAPSAAASDAMRAALLPCVIEVGLAIEAGLAVPPRGVRVAVQPERVDRERSGEQHERERGDPLALRGRHGRREAHEQRTDLHDADRL